MYKSISVKNRLTTSLRVEQTKFILEGISRVAHMFYGPGGINNCFSRVLFWTANFNMNKNMQILSEEMLVICRLLSGLNHCCFE